MEGNALPRIAVLGAGAVGCYFGGMLARAGAPVTLIGRPLHVEALSLNGSILRWPALSTADCRFGFHSDQRRAGRGNCAYLREDA